MHRHEDVDGQNADERGRLRATRLAATIAIMAGLLFATACSAEPPTVSSAGQLPTSLPSVAVESSETTASSETTMPPVSSLSTTTSSLAVMSTLPSAGTLPDLVGLDLQLAQDALQAAGWYEMISHDASGQGRLQLIDRNWVVVEQTPAAGGVVPYDKMIDLGAVKKGEPGSEVWKDPTVMPDLVGQNLQLAIDTLQAAGIYVFDYVDATGQGRRPIVHSNWIVVGQDPAPGSALTTQTLVTFRVKKVGE